MATRTKAGTFYRGKKGAGRGCCKQPAAGNWGLEISWLLIGRVVARRRSSSSRPLKAESSPFRSGVTDVSGGAGERPLQVGSAPNCLRFLLRIPHVFQSRLCRLDAGS